MYQNHHVIKGARILSLEKLSSSEIYSILISKKAVNKPILNTYFKNCSEIHLSIRAKRCIKTLSNCDNVDTILVSFQYKILNSILFPNKNLYTFVLRTTTHWSFLNTLKETPTCFFLLLHSCLMSLGKITGKISERFNSAVTDVVDCYSWTI